MISVETLQASIIQGITELMEEKKISQTRLAELTGISKQTLSANLSGKTKIPQVDFLARILHVFPDLNCRYLLFREFPKYITPSSPNQVMDIETEYITSLKGSLNVRDKENELLRLRIHYLEEEIRKLYEKTK